jgi:hypothetical protein
MPAEQDAEMVPSWIYTKTVRDPTIQMAQWRAITWALVTN